MPNIISGTSANDTLSGLSGDNSISGGAGADKLNGGAGIDTLDGGAGADTISGNSGDDLLVFDATAPAAGVDVYDGGSGKDTLKLILTLDQWFNPAVQTEIAAHVAFVLENTHWRTLEATNTEFSFTTLGVGLRVSKIENLKVIAGGIDIGDPIDDPVTLVADTMSMNEDAASVSVDVLANDTVPDLVKTLTFTQATSPAKGTVSLAGGPFVPGSAQAWLKYTPVAGAWDHLAQGATAVETFSYTVTDADGDTDTKTVTLSITGVNDGPVAVADTAGGHENQTLTIDVLANDTDKDDGHVLTLLNGSAPSGKGSASVVANQLQFDPGTDFDHLKQGATEVVILNYQMRDEHGATSSSTVQVTVTGTNDGPVAVADTAAGHENETLLIDVLANDTDVDDGHVFTLLGGSAPSGKGSVSVVANQLQFNPGTDFDHLKQGATEEVTLDYQMRDEHGATSTSTVKVTVTGTNDGPVAVADTAAGHENQTLLIDVLANDTDVDDGHVFTLLNGSAPSGKGSVSVVANQLQFNPGTDFDHLKQGATEEVTLDYQMRDEHGATSTSTVKVTVTGTNDGPVAVADTAAGHENETLLIDVLANDTDVDDGHVFTLLSGSAPSGKGSASVVANQLQFDPGTDFDHLKQGATEVVTLNYQMRDEHGATSSSTVQVTVTGTNDGPVAVPDSGAATEAGTSAGSDATGNVLTNDTDVDVGDTKVVSLVKFGATAGTVGSELSGAYGKLTLNADGGYTYVVDDTNATVQALRLSTDTLTEVFTYRVKDGSGAESETTLTLTVHGANDAPVFTSGATGTVAENAPISTVVYDAAVTDVDGLPAVFSLGGADAGLFNIDPGTGEIRFNSSADFEGGGDNLYDVTVYADDGLTTTSKAVTISVTNVNEAPSITSNGGGDSASVSIPENTTAVTTVTATDPDVPTTFVYSIVGGADQAKFTINASGQLSFVTAPNFEAPTDTPPSNSYEVKVRVSDGGLFDEQTITVNVTDVVENAAPTANADTVIFSQGTTPALFLASALLKNDTDPDNDALQVVGVTGSGVTLGAGMISVTNTALTSFTYQLSDGVNPAVTGTVNITRITIGNGAATDNIDLSALTYAASYVDLNSGADTATGGAGQDWFLAGQGDDVMVGGSTDDILIGGSGDDRLTGGAGADTLTGDGQSDQFIFNLASEGGDHITDFVSGTGNADTVRLSLAGFPLANQPAPGAETVVSVSASGTSIATADIVRWTGAVTAMDSAAEINAQLASQTGTFAGGVLVLAYDSAGKVALYYDDNAANGSSTVTLVTSFDNFVSTASLSNASDFLFV